MLYSELKQLLDEKVEQYNRPAFIEHDPIVIPHSYTSLQDREISGLFAATLAWGQRKTIIAKCRELLTLMDNDPYRFVLDHSEDDLRPLLKFKHRTFNATDLLYFITFLKHHYGRHTSLEEAFAAEMTLENETTESALIHFQHRFFDLPEHPLRTKKHVATPTRKSTCKRLNMFLRWMVRSDNQGVDFGLWKRISPAQLVCPCDLHVNRVARGLGLIARKQTDWLAALQLTSHLKKLDPLDPVRYDFALFGLGVVEHLF